MLGLTKTASALEKATVQLKWLHHFQFAGYYAALDKGFYRDAGLDVSIIEGGPTTEVEKVVAAGRADFGVGTSALLLHNAHGEDFIVLGQVFQHSPAVFLTPRKTGIRKIADMAGRRFMYSSQHGDMLALLKKHGIEENDFTQVDHQGDPYDLINGKADVMLAYSFNEPFILEQAGEAYFTFSPLTNGIDFYGDNFFTTRKLAKDRPEYVKAFREATLKGWRYALDNKAEISDLILSKYSKVKSKEWLMFEANQLYTLIQPELVELGYQNPARWKHISQTFVGLGMLPSGFDPTPIIYNPSPPRDYRILIMSIAVATMIITVLSGLVITFRRLNRQLSNTHRELEHNIGQLRVLFETSMAGILTCDPTGRITIANKRMEEMFGYSTAELIGFPYPELVHPDQKTFGTDLMHQILSKKIDHVSTERHYIRKDGTDFYGYISVRRHEDANGDLISLVCHISDITELKRAEQDQLYLEKQFLHAQKLESLGVLAGGIAHDFNNLLTGILGNISYARMLLDESHKAHKILLEAEKASQRASGLTQQLLTFAKGSQPIKKVASAKQLIESATSLVLSGSKVKCSVVIPDTINALEVDEGQIFQAFHNIIINAVQAMPDGGILSICAENATVDAQSLLPVNPGRYVKFSFTDKGHGISEENQKKIFDPYFTTKADGNGLGLASVYSIVVKHGGHISVRSTIGIGTTFEIYLPATADRPDEPADELPALLAKGSSTASILLMDDEVMIRNLAEDMLTSLGYQVQTCVNGEEAISMYKAAHKAGNTYAAVIMDLTIPGGLGGREAAKEILDFDKNAVLIVSSGYSNDPVMAEYGKFGFRAVLAKPYKANEIVMVLDELLNAKHLA
jgi:PAS domain S-box-containing protein